MPKSFDVMYLAEVVLEVVSGDRDKAGTTRPGQSPATISLRDDVGRAEPESLS